MSGFIQLRNLAKQGLAAAGNILSARIAAARDWATPVIERYTPAALRNASPLQRKTLTGVAVAAVHLLFIAVLIFGLRLNASPPQVPEMTLVLDTINSSPARSAPAAPQFETPQNAITMEPMVEVEDPSPSDTTALSSGSGVTRPAEAIGDFHSVPPLSDTLLALAKRTLLRLRLSIAIDGTVSEAMVDQSSGSGDVDRIALAWVKTHWRYRPALQAGQAIEVTTTALVPF